MKPFLHGRKTSSSGPLAAPSAPHVFPQRGAPCAAPSGPHVEVVKQGDKVTRLIVTCSCGERIEVDCLYPANG